MIKLIKESAYSELGFNSRKDYLNSLADDYGVDVQTVYGLASVLGPDEDFDALVTELEDMAYGGDYTGDDDTYTFDQALDWYLYHSTYSKYLVCDEDHDEYDYYIEEFETYEKAARKIIINLCRYESDCILYDKRKHLKITYHADKLDVSGLDMGIYKNKRWYEEDPEMFVDPYSVGEDAATENIRKILSMCEVRSEKY